MSRNIYCNPKLVIDGIEIKSLTSANFKDTGNNKISILNAKFSEPDLENMSLFNKRVEYYLNYGSEDSCPLFRGYIKSYTSTDTNFTISALDVRTLLSGREAYPVVIDDKNNYDGQTISQFLIDVVDNQLELDEGFSTSATNDIDKPVYMTGYRGKTPVYQVLTSALEKKLDEDDLLNPQSYFIDVIHEENNSSIVFRKTVNEDSRTDLLLSYFDGIITLNFVERAAPSFIICQTTDGEQVRLDYGNAPHGKVGFQYDGIYSSRGEAQEALIPILLSKQDSELDITVTTSKGHYVSLGNIVSLNVKDNKIAGSYRVTSKVVNYTGGTVSCVLTLNKVPINLSDYLSP
tara:strand:- start:485 stop:1525 length:1041 start_codon:yes stop_codon:yes gene_type:complete